MHAWVNRFNVNWSKNNFNKYKHKLSNKDRTDNVKRCKRKIETKKGKSNKPKKVVRIGNALRFTIDFYFTYNAKIEDFFSSYDFGFVISCEIRNIIFSKIEKKKKEKRIKFHVMICDMKRQLLSQSTFHSIAFFSRFRFVCNVCNHFVLSIFHSHVTNIIEYLTDWRQQWYETFFANETNEGGKTEIERNSMWNY